MTKQNEDIDAIKQLVEDWHAGCLASDAEALLSLYGDDQILMPQNQPVVTGGRLSDHSIRPCLRSFLSMAMVN